jgi:hypothetical protein
MIMGIGIFYAIETRESEESSWQYLDDINLYDDDKPFDSYLGTIHAQNVMEVFPRKNDEKYPYDLAKATKESLGIVGYSSDPEYYAVASTLTEILKITEDKINGINFTKKIQVLKQLSSDPDNIRLVIEFD